MTRPLIYHGLRYHRSTASAFKDAQYGAAIERPVPSLWRRFVNFIGSV